MSLLSSSLAYNLHRWVITHSIDCPTYSYTTSDPFRLLTTNSTFWFVHPNIHSNWRNGSSQTFQQTNTHTNDDSSTFVRPLPGFKKAKTFHCICFNSSKCHWWYLWFSIWGLFFHFFHGFFACIYGGHSSTFAHCPSTAKPLNQVRAKRITRWPFYIKLISN